jgi:hypothetical protein
MESHWVSTGKRLVVRSSAHAPVRRETPQFARTEGCSASPRAVLVADGRFSALEFAGNPRAVHGPVSRHRPSQGPAGAVATASGPVSSCACAYASVQLTKPGTLARRSGPRPGHGRVRPSLPSSSRPENQRRRGTFTAREVPSSRPPELWSGEKDQVTGQKGSGWSHWRGRKLWAYFLHLRHVSVLGSALSARLSWTSNRLAEGCRRRWRRSPPALRRRLCRHLVRRWWGRVG